MITEDYVSFELAKLLKEKGFNEPCYTCYIVGNEISHYDYYLSNSELRDGVISASTLQMAIKWLEIEKHIAIIPFLSSILDYEQFLWDVKIVVAETGETYSQGWVYENREQAVEATLKYTLENLI